MKGLMRSSKKLFPVHSHYSKYTAYQNFEEILERLFGQSEAISPIPDQRNIGVWSDIIYNSMEPGFAEVYREESERFNLNIRPILGSVVGRARAYDLIKEAFPIIFKKPHETMNSEVLEYNKLLLQDPQLNVWKHDFSSILHNVWVTDPYRAKDIIAPNCKEASINFKGENGEKLKVWKPAFSGIDQEDSAFYYSLMNFRKILKDKDIIHVLWTNIDVDTFPFPQDIPNLRKISGFEQSHLPMPPFIVINVTNERIVNESILLQKGVQIPKDLKASISKVHSYLEEIGFNDLRCIGAKADVIRPAVLYENGGIYWDFDFVCFDPDGFEGQLNLEKLVKNYNAIFSLATAVDGSAIFQNDILIFNRPHHPIARTLMYLIKDNLLHKNLPLYLEELFNYNQSSGLAVFATGPFTLSVAIALSNELQSAVLSAKNENQVARLLFELEKRNVNDTVIEIVNELLAMDEAEINTADLALPGKVLFDVPGELDMFFRTEVDYIIPDGMGYGMNIGSWVQRA